MTCPEIDCNAKFSSDQVREILTSAGGKCGHDARLELVAFDSQAVHYRLSALCDSLDGRRALAETALDDLSKAGIQLGRSRAVNE